MSSNNRSTSSNIKKTRIAQVLAHARYEISDDYQLPQQQQQPFVTTSSSIEASTTSIVGNESISLEYPSRPYTPASYDERISLDSNLNQQNRLYNSNNNNYNRKSKTSNTSSFLHKQLKENLSLSRDPYKSSNSTATNNNNLTVNNNSYSTKIIIILKPLLNDLKDIEMNIEDTRSDVIINVITLPMDSLFKILRGITSISDFNADMINDMESLSSCLVTILSQLVNRETNNTNNNSSSSSNTSVDCQYILVLIKYTLKVLIVQLTFSNSTTETNNNATSLSFDTQQLSFHLKEITHGLYRLCTLSTSTTTSSEKGFGKGIVFKLQLTTSTSTSSYVSMDRDNGYKEDGCDISSIDDQDYESNISSNILRSSASSSSKVDSDTFSLACADLLLKLIHLLWDKLPTELIYLYKYMISKHTSIDHDLESVLGNRYTSLINRYLQCISYSTAILRIISSNEIDTKRLVHAGTLKVLKKGLLFYQKNEVLLRFLKQIQSTTSNLSSIGSSTNKGTKENKLIQELINTAVQSIIQILGIIRNFSIEKYGRTQLEEYELVGCFCYLQSIYSFYPLVILNTARIIAKLSLIESFRIQINKNSFHVQCLVNVIIQQSTLCKQIMDGEVVSITATTVPTLTYDKHEDIDEDEDKEDVTSWPYWYTWPLITRICFILGNLTTTNIEQRKLIGLEYNLIDHLLLLLQACAESLYQLQQTKSLYGPNYSNHTSSNRDNNDSECEIDELDRFHSTAANDADAADDNVINNKKPTIGSYSNEEDEDTSGERDLRDATIKLVRLLVNLTIDEQIGHILSDRRDIYQMLFKLLSSATNEIDPQEELLLNVIALCTNITYYSNCYHTIDQKKFLDANIKDNNNNDDDIHKDIGMKTDQQLVELSIHIGHCLFHNNIEIVLETARVLGNLSRNSYVRKSLIKHRTDEALLLLLAHTQSDILCAITGVFINLSSDKYCRTLLLKPININIIQTFSELLRRVSFKDIQLAILVCQVIYNLLCSNKGLVTSNTNNNTNSNYHNNSSNNNNTLINEVDIQLLNQCLSIELKEYLYDTLLELSECAYDITHININEASKDTMVDLFVNSATSNSNNSSSNNNSKVYDKFYRISTSIMSILDETNVKTIFGWHDLN